MSFITFLRENRAFLFAGFLLAFTSSYGQTWFISIFADQIKSTFGLTDGGWGAVYTLGTTASAIVMVWAGALTDRWRIRTILPVVVAGLAGACLIMAGAASLGLGGLTAACVLTFVVFSLRFFGQGMTSHLSVVAMARWFVATRGRALSIASIGHSAAQAVLPLGFVALLGVIDWRLLWVGAAGLALLALPVLVRLLRLERTPQSIASDDQVAGLGGRHWTRAEVLRHPLFWFMVPVLLGPSAWGTALFFQQVHLTAVKGWSLAEFVALMPAMVSVTVATTFISGWAVDRFGSGRLMPLYVLPFAACFFLMATAQTISGALVALVIVAAGMGMQQTTPNAFWAEYFGTRHVGSIKAAAAAIMVFGSAIGPGITGAFIDWGVDFPEQMRWIAAYFVMASISGAAGIWWVRGDLPPRTLAAT